jgi:hypothetical protein
VYDSVLCEQWGEWETVVQQWAGGVLDKSDNGTEVNSEVLLKYVSMSHAADIVITMMSTKLKALKYDLMELIFPGGLFYFYYIPVKILWILLIYI